MVEFKPESMSCVRNVLEVWAFKGKEFKWKHHFICFIPIQQDVYGVRAHYGLTFSARKKITIVLVAAGRSGRDAPLHVFFFLFYFLYKQGGRVKLQHCGWCGQGAVWSVDVVGTSNRHQEQLSNSGSSCPSGAWELRSLQCACPSRGQLQRGKFKNGIRFKCNTAKYSTGGSRPAQISFNIT